MASPKTIALRKPRMVTVHNLTKVGMQCRTRDGAKYELQKSGTIVRANKDQRSPKERKAARRAVASTVNT